MKGATVSREERMQQPTFDLPGGSGERPPHPNDQSSEPEGAFYTAEALAEMSAGELEDHRRAMIEFDSSGGKNAQLIAGEIKRRGLTAQQLAEAWDQLHRENLFRGFKG